MKMAHVAFVFILLELFFASNSLKASHSREEPPSGQSLVKQRGERKSKVCKGVTSLSATVAIHNKSSSTPAAINKKLSSIPKVIHLTFKSIEELPQCVPDSYHKVNPDFEIRKWGDKEIVQFLKKDFSQKHVDVFNFIPDGEIKADMFRLAVLYKLGGWYADMDITLKQPFDNFVDPNADIVIGGSMTFFMVNPIIFGAKPGQKVILDALDRMVALRAQPYNYWTWSVCSNMWTALNATFDGTLGPTNIAATQTSPHGLKVQTLEEKYCHYAHNGAQTIGTFKNETMVADNAEGCQPGLTEMAPHGGR